MSSRKLMVPQLVMDKRANEDNSSTCAICTARQRTGTTEVFILTDGADRHFFNVDRAKGIVADGRTAIPISVATVLRLLAVNEHDVAHLAHVDPGNPGILALRFGGLVLLDGIHRAACCIRDNKSFHAFMLDHEESQSCIVREDIAARDPEAIVQKLRRVLGTAPRTDRIEAAIDCSPATLEQVRTLLSPDENQRFLLRLLRGKFTRSE